MIDRIKEIIEEEELWKRTKKRRKVNRRWFLFIMLRKNNLTYHKIGELFSLSHSTVIHGENQAIMYGKIKDEIYLLDTLDLSLEFNGMVFLEMERDLSEDVLNCKTLPVLGKIKSRIINNVYKKN
jgi:hypothetical protein